MTNFDEQQRQALRFNCPSLYHMPEMGAMQFARKDAALHLANGSTIHMVKTDAKKIVGSSTKQAKARGL